MTFDEWWKAERLDTPLFEDHAREIWDTVSKAEREACAKVCENEALTCPSDSEGDEAYDNAIRHAAAAIRART